jgi:hypothetical protein
MGLDEARIKLRIHDTAISNPEPRYNEKANDGRKKILTPPIRRYFAIVTDS